MSDVVCIGQACVDFFINGLEANFNPADMHSACDDFTIEIGGDSTNESRILKRMGVDVSVIHRRGDDTTGMIVKNLFEKDGVDISKCYVVPGMKTPLVVIFPQGESERHVISGKRTWNSQSFEIIPGMIGGAKVVSFASLLGHPFKDPENVYNAAKLVKDSGAVLCVDMNLFGDPEIEPYAESMKFFDYFFPNHTEAMGWTGADSVEDAADYFLGKGVKNIIIKTGKTGCFVKNSNLKIHLPAFEVDKVIDTTGAGDNFAAGFICAMLDGKSLRERLIFASAASAIAIQVVGASTGVQSKQQVEDTVAEQKINHPEVMERFFAL